MCHKACEGASTKTIRTGQGDFEQCRACDLRVRWDLSDHPFFGFKNACDLRAGRILQRAKEIAGVAKDE